MAEQAEQKAWVDFKAIKDYVTMDMVINHYKIDWLKRKDNELHGRCPIHQGDGKDTFHVNTTKNIFNCFSCKKKGNVLDLVAAMENCSVKEAAGKLSGWFSVDGGVGENSGDAKKEKASSSPVVTIPVAASKENITPKNIPLTFQLKNIDHDHVYMLERGLTTETIKTFGVGFYSGKGSMTGRVVIPIHNELGELVAYCGRSVDGGEPKYMLPSGFHKSEILYNLHRVKGGGVIVVEGFFDCMKVCQSGYPNVVALMGSSMSAAQEKLLCSRFQKVTILLDGDEAGKRGAEEIASRLVKKLYVRIVELQDGKQPDGMTAEELGNLLQ